jgi:hypothetical protein
MTNTKNEALKLALEALEEIALAGMSGTGQESEEAMTAWHARQAWKFIGIAARALEPIKQALAAPVQEQPSETIVQTFTGLPMRKLRGLLTDGYRVNGVSFERTQEDGTVQRGAATTGGMVLWWNQTPEQKRPQNCGTGYCSCIECVMEPAPVQVDAWPCVIAEADFEQDTITLKMQCSDYKVGAGQHWLHTNQPSAQPAVPDAITDSGENPDYRAGWNECRETMLQILKARTL